MDEELKDFLVLQLAPEIFQAVAGFEQVRVDLRVSVLMFGGAAQFKFQFIVGDVNAFAFGNRGENPRLFNLFNDIWPQMGWEPDVFRAAYLTGCSFLCILSGELPLQVLQCLLHYRFRHGDVGFLNELIQQFCALSVYLPAPLLLDEVIPDNAVELGIILISQVLREFVIEFR